MDRITYSTDDREAVEKGLVSLPVVSVVRSTLGGEERASLIIKVSLDPEEDWTNNIFQNSRFGMFSISEGRLECFSRSHKTEKFRAGKIKDTDHAIKRILQWAERNQS